jgi:monoamine oxidase
MTNGHVEVVIIGGGAAGVAAGRRLYEAGIDCLVVEARARLGGRGWTIIDLAGVALDLGCGWLHSADRNPWRRIADEQGYSIDKTPPPWGRPSIPVGFAPSEQQAYFDAIRAFYARLDAAAANDSDGPAAALLEPGSRWNNLINAVSTYVSGTELDRVSVRDFDRYADSGINWRVVEGYGATIATYGKSLRIALEAPVHRIDHSGRRLKIETAKGTITTEQAIVTVPSTVLAESEFLFTPTLPEKTEAARSVPLGLADKLFLSLDRAEEFEKDSRLFGRTDRTGTGTYHFRPFGRPQIEAYFGGKLAADLERNGLLAFFDFAASELVGLFGSAFASRIKPIHMHCWGLDPFSRGSYSCALPGRADCRSTLAAAVDDRLFFAGEACSSNDFSTAHGAWFSGAHAAEQVIAARRKGNHSNVDRGK